MSRNNVVLATLAALIWGLVPIVFTGVQGDISSTAGAVIHLGSVAAVVLTFVLSRIKLQDRAGFWRWVGVVFSATGCAVLALVPGSGEAHWSCTGPWLYLGMGSAAVAFGLWGYLAARHGPNAIAPFVLLSPAVSEAAAITAVGRVQAVQGVALVFIVLGFALALWHRRIREAVDRSRPAQKPSPEVLFDYFTIR